MVVKINFERSDANQNDGLCRLVLENPDKGGGDNLGTFRGYSLGASVDGPRENHPWWTWKNPHDPLEEVTFSPSIIQHVGDRQMFHIFIENGEVEHCNNCQCGCSD